MGFTKIIIDASLLFLLFFIYIYIYIYIFFIINYHLNPRERPCRKTFVKFFFLKTYGILLRMTKQTGLPGPPPPEKFVIFDYFGESVKYHESLVALGSSHRGDDWMHNCSAGGLHELRYKP